MNTDPNRENEVDDSDHYLECTTIEVGEDLGAGTPTGHVIMPDGGTVVFDGNGFKKP